MTTINIVTIFNKYKIIFICIFLIATTSLVYWQISTHDFISFDDNDYVYENSHVVQGITKENIIWAFTFADHERTYWHPVTWVSHMLDCELYGLNAGHHHLTSLILHILNTILLFIVLNKMTNAPWKSAVVASFFALHPVNVDSVAWLAERKNLLSTFFLLLTIYAYTAYAKKNHVSYYLLALFVFILGLLSKPMLVTLPFMLLLIDFWPLGRIRIESSGETTDSIIKQLLNQKPIISKIILEKIPFLILSFASIYISLSSFDTITTGFVSNSSPMTVRAANASVSYLQYIFLLLFPHNLDFFYPYPQYVPFVHAALSGILLVTITAITLSQAKRLPYLAVGWLWFLGSLLPVIGLVQRGLWPAFAERWAYIPFIGLFIILVWGLHDMSSAFKVKKTASAVLIAMPLIIFMVLTWKQAGHWENSETLYQHSIKVNPGNYVALINLGVALAYEGENEKAIEYFNRSLVINPRLAISQYNLGDVLATMKKTDEAIDHYYKAIIIKSDYIGAYRKLVDILWDQGKKEETIRVLSKALHANPDSRELANNLGEALAKNGQKEDAIKHYLKVIQQDPHNAIACNNLALLFMEKEENDTAIDYFSRAVSIDPDYVKAHINLASLLKRIGKIEESKNHLIKAIEIDPENETGHFYLGVIYYQLENDALAINHFNEALRINTDNAETHYYLAVCYTRTGTLEDIIHHSREAVRLNSNFVEAQKILDTSILRKNDIEQKMTGFEEKLAANPKDPDLLFKLAVMNKMTGNYDKSLYYLHKMEMLQPKNPNILYNISCIFSKKNNIEESLNYLKKAIEKGFNDWVLLKNDIDLQNIRTSDYYKKLIATY